MVFQRNSARGRMIKRFIRWIVLSILRATEALAISIVFNLQYFSERASWTTGKAVFFSCCKISYVASYNQRPTFIVTSD